MLCNFTTLDTSAKISRNRWKYFTAYQRYSKNDGSAVNCVGIHQDKIQRTTDNSDIVLIYATGKRRFHSQQTKLCCWCLEMFGWPYRLTFVMHRNLSHVTRASHWDDRFSFSAGHGTPDTRPDITAAPSYDRTAVGILWSPSVCSRIG